MLQPHQPDQSANGHCVLQSQLPSFLQNERAILVRISRFQLLSIAALNNRYTHLITIAQAHRQEAGNLAASPHQQNSLLAIFQPDVSPDKRQKRAIDSGFIVFMPLALHLVSCNGGLVDEP